MMRSPARLRVAVAALLLAAGPWLAAQAPAPKGAATASEGELDDARAVVAVAVPAAGSGAAEALRFAEALAVSLAREAGATGLAAVRAAPLDYELPEPEAARGAALASGARWVFIARVSVESRRILWRAAAYDGRDGSLFGADAFSAYAGLSALPLLDASAKGVAAAAAAARAAPQRPVPIDYRLAFSSRDEGAAVSFGLPGSEAFAAGAIAGGGLEAPYLPFLPGERLVVGLEKPGYWPGDMTVKIKPMASTIALPSLLKKTVFSLGANYGTGRMLGAAVSARWYPLPDRVYLRAENALWAAYDFRPGSKAVLHDELRLGAGAYLFFDPAARFRASLGLGLSGIATFFTQPGLSSPTAFDLCLEPVFFTLEWHEPTWAFVLEQRFPYSLGLESGLLPRDWLELGGKGPLFVSLGVIFKL